VVRRRLKREGAGSERSGRKKEIGTEGANGTERRMTTTF